MVTKTTRRRISASKRSPFQVATFRLTKREGGGFAVMRFKRVGGTSSETNFFKTRKQADIFARKLRRKL